MAKLFATDWNIESFYLLDDFFPSPGSDSNANFSERSSCVSRNISGHKFRANHIKRNEPEIATSKSHDEALSGKKERKKFEPRKIAQRAFLRNCNRTCCFFVRMSFSRTIVSRLSPPPSCCVKSTKLNQLLNAYLSSVSSVVCTSKLRNQINCEQFYFSGVLVSVSPL